MPFSNLLYEVGLSWFLLLPNTLFLTKVSSFFLSLSLFFFFCQLFIRLFLFHFTASFLVSLNHILNPPHISHQKHHIYSLRSHCFSLFSKKKLINWYPATELEASPIDFSRFECSLNSTASHCLATWASRPSGYYSDGFLMEVLAQRNAWEQLPLQNWGSQGFSLYFIPWHLKKGGKRRGYRKRRPTYCKGLDNQLQFLLYTGWKEILYNTLSLFMPWNYPTPFLTGPLDSDNKDSLRMGPA